MKEIKLMNQYTESKEVKMSKNTITIEGKNGIMLIEGIDYILNMKKGSITITGEGFSKFPAIIMVPYKSESHHKRKGNYPHCKGTGNAEENVQKRRQKEIQ